MRILIVNKALFLIKIYCFIFYRIIKFTNYYRIIKLIIDGNNFVCKTESFCCNSNQFAFTFFVSNFTIKAEEKCWKVHQINGKQVRPKFALNKYKVCINFLLITTDNKWINKLGLKFISTVWIWSKALQESTWILTANICFECSFEVYQRTLFYFHLHKFLCQLCLKKFVRKQFNKCQCRSRAKFECVNFVAHFFECFVHKILSGKILATAESF